MARGKTIDAVIADAEQIDRVWVANPTFALGAVTRASFRGQIDDLDAARNHTEDLRTQLTDAVNSANAKADALADITIRARSGIKAVYGPDSTQYEQAGGTRLSDRKKPSSKKKPSE
jgi:hypothetical protein